MCVSAPLNLVSVHRSEEPPCLYIRTTATAQVPYISVQCDKPNTCDDSTIEVTSTLLHRLHLTDPSPSIFVLPSLLSLYNCLIPSLAVHALRCNCTHSDACPEGNTCEVFKSALSKVHCEVSVTVLNDSTVGAVHYYCQEDTLTGQICPPKPSHGSGYKGMQLVMHANYIKHMIRFLFIVQSIMSAVKTVTSAAGKLINLYSVFYIVCMKYNIHISIYRLHRCLIPSNLPDTVLLQLREFLDPDCEIPLPSSPSLTPSYTTVFPNATNQCEDYCIFL